MPAAVDEGGMMMQQQRPPPDEEEAGIDSGAPAFVFKPAPEGTFAQAIVSRSTEAASAAAASASAALSGNTRVCNAR